MSLDVFLPGKPVGKGRPVFSRTGERVTARTPSLTRRWEAIAAARIRDAFREPTIPREVAVTVEIVALVARTRAQDGRRTIRPKGKRDDGRLVHTGKPDADNIAKIVLDALVRGGVLEDDTSVTRLVVERWRVASDETPGVHVRVRRTGERA